MQNLQENKLSANVTGSISANLMAANLQCIFKYVLQICTKTLTTSFSANYAFQKQKCKFHCWLQCKFNGWLVLVQFTQTLLVQFSNFYNNSYPLENLVQISLFRKNVFSAVFMETKLQCKLHRSN